ncbi:MAG: hypothetical protein MJY99_10575 [Fibrobacter sp.]|nr:hypothetical protein [Fibrobacter sp.]
MKKTILLLVVAIQVLFAQNIIDGTSLPEQESNCYEDVDLAGFYVVKESLDLTENNNYFYETFYMNHKKNSVNIQGTIASIDTSRVELISSNGNIILYYFFSAYSVETAIKISLKDVWLNIPNGNDSAMCNAFDSSRVFIPSSMKKLEVGEKIEIENYLAIANDSCYANRLGISTQIYSLTGIFRSENVQLFHSERKGKTKEKKVFHKNVKGQSVLQPPAYGVEF